MGWSLLVMVCRLNGLLESIPYWDFSISVHKWDWPVVFVSVLCCCYECMMSAVRGVLLKNEMWWWLGSFIYLQQVKETGDLHPKHCLLEGRVSPCLYTVWSITCWYFSLQLAKLIQMGSLVKLIQLQLHLQNTVLYLNNRQE